MVGPQESEHDDLTLIQLQLFGHDMGAVGKARWGITVRLSTQLREWFGYFPSCRGKSNCDCAVLAVGHFE